MHAPRFVAPLLIGAALTATCPAQDAPVVPEIPVEESPFFVLNDAPLNRGARARALLNSPANQYPLNKTSDRSASKMFTRFFTDMFASVHLAKGKPDSKLVIEPSSFSLDDRREITVNFTVFNRTQRLVKLDFPTSQRIEILVRDGNGQIIEKWSDDRAFDDVSGVLMINPGERVEYAEKIATRDMQPGQTYSIEASMANNPEYTKAGTVKPSGSTRPPAPNPTPAPGGEPVPTPSPTPGA